MKKQNTLPLVIGIILFFLAVGSRFLDLPYNMSPLIGVALFSGFLFKTTKYGMFIPVLGYYVSDVILNNTVYRSSFSGDGFVWFSDHMIWTYGSIFLIYGIGRYIRVQYQIGDVILRSLVSAVMFFLITNFGTWLLSGMYEPTVQGIMVCYTSAIPFFRATLVASLLFSSVLFLVYKVLLVALEPRIQIDYSKE